MSVLVISNELLKIFSIFGVTGVCMIGAYGQYHQRKQILESKDSRNVSMVWTITFAILSASFVIQGFATESYTMQFHGILRVAMYVLIFIAFFVSGYKFNDFDASVLLVLSAILVGMMIHDDIRDFHFQVLGYLAVFATCHQPYVIYKNKTRGDVSIVMLGTYNLGVMFWMLYAWLDKNFELFWVSTAFFIVYTTTMVLWYVIEDDTVDA